MEASHIASINKCQNYNIIIVLLSLYEIMHLGKDCVKKNLQKELTYKY